MRHKKRAGKSPPFTTDFLTYGQVADIAKVCVILPSLATTLKAIGPPGVPQLRVRIELPVGVTDAGAKEQEEPVAVGSAGEQLRLTDKL